MRRRRFLKRFLGGALALATPFWWLATRIAPARVREAFAARRYPGPVAELDNEAVRKPGRWAG